MEDTIQMITKNPISKTMFLPEHSNARTNTPVSNEIMYEVDDVYMTELFYFY